MKEGWGVGQQVYHAVLSDRLGDTRYDLDEIVDEIVTTYGFMDLDEIPGDGWTGIAEKHRLDGGDHPD